MTWPRPRFHSRATRALHTSKRGPGGGTLILRDDNQVLFLPISMLCSQFIQDKFRREPVQVLFVAEGDHGIHAHGAAGRKVSGESRYNGENNRNGGERGRVIGRDAEEHVPK